MSKLLGTKDLFMLVLPLVAGTILYLGLGNLLKRIFPMKEEYITTSSLPDVLEFKDYEFIDPELFAASIKVKPYKITTSQKNNSITTENKEPPPSYKISFIYIGNHKYVIIDNKLYKEGDTLPSSEKIVKITKSGVLLRGKWGDRWVKFLN